MQKPNARDQEWKSSVSGFSNRSLEGWQLDLFDKKKIIPVYYKDRGNNGKKTKDKTSNFSTA